MKTWTMMAAMLVLAMIVGVAQAEDKKPAKPKAPSVAGAITEVSADSITVQPGDAAKPKVTAAITDATKIKVDGKDAKAADLKVGQKVRVILDADSKNAVAIAVGDMKGHGEGRK